MIENKNAFRNLVGCNDFHFLFAGCQTYTNRNSASNGQFNTYDAFAKRNANLYCSANKISASNGQINTYLAFTKRYADPYSSAAGNQLENLHQRKVQCQLKVSRILGIR